LSWRGVREAAKDAGYCRGRSREMLSRMTTCQLDLRRRCRKGCDGMHRSQHQLAFGTGPACVLWPNRIAAGRDAMASCKAMGLPGGRGSPIGRRDRDGGQAACPIRVLRLARLATRPPASARVAARTASAPTGHLGWLSGWAGGVGACTRGCQGSPTWPSVGGRRASPLIADWWAGAWRWCQDSPT
jgi:hypothetical protein